MSELIQQYRKLESTFDKRAFAQNHFEDALAELEYLQVEIENNAKNWAGALGEVQRENEQLRVELGKLLNEEQHVRELTARNKVLSDKLSQIRDFVRENEKKFSNTAGPWQYGYNTAMANIAALLEQKDQGWIFRRSQESGSAGGPLFWSRSP